MVISRTYSLILLCALGLAGEEKSLTILHFNDFHAAITPDENGRGGLAYLAGTIERERQGCKSCVLLNAGDLVQGSPVSTIFKGMPVFELANRLKIDAATLGNHDFDYGWRQTARFVDKAKFPIVQADIRDRGGKLLGDKPYVIIKRNGLRVGVIGVMTGSLKSLTTAETRGPWEATPMIETLRKYARELQPRTDLIVALAHLGGTEEDRILREVPEVSVVVGGHEHAGLAEAKKVEKRTAVRLQPNGRELGRLDLKVETGCKCVTSASWQRIPVLAKSSPADAEIAKQVAKWEKKVEEVVNVPIGVAKREIAGDELKALIERATVEEMGVDFSYMNRGGVRAPLPAGQLLARHVWVMYPFDNKVVVGRFKGKDLPKVITEGRQIDPEREYTLAVNDFTAANQDSPAQLGSKGLVFPKVGPLQRDLLIEWIRKKKILE